MSRGNWNKIKRSKFFYVTTYRKMISGIVACQLLNLILCLAVIYSYLNVSEQMFYATSGINPPIEIKSMNTPNYSSEPLLPPDPTDEDSNKLIPE